jgi:hypothetical protein
MMHRPADSLNRISLNKRTTIMRSPIASLICTIAAVLFSTLHVEAETAKEIVQKAIDAHGGLDNLKKYPAAKITSKGKMTMMGAEINVEAEETFQMPDQFKSVMKMDFAGQKIAIEQIINSGKIKMTAGGMAPPLSDAMKEDLKNSMDVHLATEIYPLLDDKKFELSVIEKPAKVGDKEVVGVLVKTKAGKEIKFFFDAKTFLLQMIERKGLDFAEREVAQEMRILGYKKIDGIQRQMKYELVFDGKKVGEFEVVDYKQLDKVDKKEFDISD